jgi:POT family proton-dependent oligopeptide transporter
VFYGGVIVMCGHIALAVLPGLTGVGVGLALIALGSGALKANASSLFGTLYDKDDPCDGGFTLCYLGINLGAFIGPLITGLLQTRIGSHRFSPRCGRGWVSAPRPPRASSPTG